MEFSLRMLTATRRYHFKTVLRKGSLKVICCFSRPHSDDFNDVHLQAKISLRQLLQIDLMPWLRSSDAGYPQKFRATSLRQLLPFIAIKDTVRLSEYFRSIPASIWVNKNVNIHNETNVERFLDSPKFLEWTKFLKKNFSVYRFTFDIYIICQNIK